MGAYFDNSDADKDHRYYRNEGRLKLGQKKLYELAEQNNYTLQVFNSLTVGLLSSSEGILLHLNK